MAHDERAMTTRQAGGAVATEAPSNPWASVGLLKPYSGGEVISRPRVDALATISAGFRDKESGRPVVSRDGTIHIAPPFGQAPGLMAALEAREHKALTIAVVHNDPSEILQQRFAAYSTTRVEAHGDANTITVIHLKNTGKKDKNGKAIFEPERETVRRGESPDRFAELAATMKVQTSMYFALAYWTSDTPPRPRLYFPDGLGLYRLRFISLNSAEAIRGALYHVASINGGVVAGVPLELAIVYQDVAGPDGSRRNVPIWTLRLRPPETIQLEPQTIRAILTAGAEQARILSIAAPRQETLELAEYEGPDVDLDETRIVDGQIVGPSQRDVDQLAGGGRIRDPKAWRSAFMTMAGRSSLKDKENRQPFMLAATKGRTDSLTVFSETATLKEGNDLAALAADWIRREREASVDPPAPRPATPEGERRIRSYEEMFGDDTEDEGAPMRAEAPAPRPAQVTPEVHAAAILTGAPVAASERFELPPEPDWGSWEAVQPPRPTVLQAWGEWTSAAHRLDSKYVGPDPSTLPTDRLILALGSIVSAVERVHAERFGRAEAEPQLVDAF